MSQDATDRHKRVLAALVREYIASGEPVASSVLVTAAGLGVSSATVRSILSRLEEEGYVQQPHTSAGRIPTDRGYRNSDRKSTRLNSSHLVISYAVFCLKKKNSRITRRSLSPRTSSAH